MRRQGLHEVALGHGVCCLAHIAPLGRLQRVPACPVTLMLCSACLACLGMSVMSALGQFDSDVLSLEGCPSPCNACKSSLSLVTGTPYLYLAPLDWPCALPLLVCSTLLVEALHALARPELVII